MKKIWLAIAKIALKRLSSKDARKVVAAVRLESRGWARGGFAGCWRPSTEEAMLLGIEGNTYYPEAEALHYIGDREPENGGSKPGVLARIAIHFKEACRTNEPQSTAAIGLSLLMVAACAQRAGDVPWWMWVTCALFWPAIAFFANLMSPIPDCNESSHDALN